MKKYLILITISLVALLIGIGFIIGGFAYRKSTNDFFESANSTTATIDRIERYLDSDGEYEYDVFVSYEAEGQIFNNVELNYYSSSMNEGQEFTVYYQSNRPSSIKVKEGSMLFFIVFVIAGSAWALVGLISLVLILLDKRKQKLKITEIY